MKKALSLILVCLFLVSMMIPVSAAQFINAYETIQAENYSEASCASVLGLGSTHYLENCLDAGGGKNVFDWQRNTYFKYANVDFGSDAAYGFSARVADFSDHADLKIILDSINGPVIGTLHIVSTGKQQDWETQSCPITPTSGMHDVFLKFENNPAKASLNYFTFLHTVPEETVRPTYSYEPLPANWQGRDTRPDTWVATDMLGEAVADNRMVGNPRSNKYVGIFYHLFLTRKQGEVYDNSRLLEENYFDPAYGPVNTDHFWGKPIFDYYRNIDTYVIRRHAQLLYNAGVDVIIFDTSNAGFPFAPYWMAIVDTLYQMREEGLNTPQFAFHTGDGTDGTNKLAAYLYKNLYSTGKYRELWFMWDGKPLMLGNSTQLSAQYRNVFTFRRSWAWQSGENQFPWLDNTPQGYGWNESADKPEATSVCLAQHATTNKGKSYSGGVEPANVSEETTLELINFREQWEHALSLDPEFIFVTAWNEWVASNYYAAEGQDFLGRKLSANDYYFVDEYNPEFSRDIEPSDGFLGDEAYMKLAHYIRLFKGARAVGAANGSHTISINESFAQWDTVEPAFYDSVGDVTHRNELAYAGYTTLVNQSGRNDFDTLKVAYDAENLYFYVKTVDNLTTKASKSWMTLFIDADQNAKTGWNGYDYVLNRRLSSDSVGILQKNVGNAWKWEDVEAIPFNASGNELQLAIPRSAVGLDNAELYFRFKWADNFGESGNIMDFYNIGDTAPDGRFAYQFNQVSTSAVQSRPAHDRYAGQVETVGSVYEAEYADRSISLPIEYEHTGFSGIGYAGGFSSIGASLSFSVASKDAGIYKGMLRYANGQANGRTLSLYVNGTYVRQLTLPVVAPADWSQWEMLAFDIPLDAGKNTVVLARDAQDTGEVNVDYFSVDFSKGRTFECEDGILRITRCNTDKQGYHGRGFTDTWTQIGASATLQIESSRETDYTLQIRYANAQRDEKTLSLYVNGHKLQQVIFPVVAMSDWNTWGTVSYRVPLVCGSNSVMLKYDSGDSGNINIDALTLVPKSASWLQAENAVLSGGVQINCNHSGYVGTGFTDSWSTAGAKASFTANCEATGYYDLIVRYANGEASGRTLNLYVNRKFVQTLHFPVVSSADWNAWREISFSKILKFYKGINSIVLAYDNGNNGKLNIDSIAFQ